MRKIRTLLRGERPNGVYRAAGWLPAALIRSAARRAGWRTARLDGRAVDDKAGFLDACAQALHFPPYFGHNWDALVDCLRSLPWMPAEGTLILLDNAAHLIEADPQTWATAGSILADIADEWTEHGGRFAVLVRNSRGLADLPWL